MHIESDSIFNLQIPLFLACNTVVHAVVRLKLNDGASSFIKFLRSAILKIEQAIRMFSSSVVLENCRFPNSCTALRVGKVQYEEGITITSWLSQKRNLFLFSFFSVEIWQFICQQYWQIEGDCWRLYGPTITSNFIRVNPAFTMSRPRLIFEFRTFCSETR